MASKRISINDLLCSDPPSEDVPKPTTSSVIPEPIILAPHLRKPHSQTFDTPGARPSSSSSTSSTSIFARRSPEINTLPPSSRPMSSGSTSQHSQHSQRQSPVLMRAPQNMSLSPPVSTAQGQPFLGLDALVHAASEERRRIDTSDMPRPRSSRSSDDGPSRAHQLHILPDHVLNEEQRQEQAILRHHHQRDLNSRARSSSSSYAHPPPSRSPTDPFQRNRDAGYSNSSNASISPRTMTVPLGPPPYPMMSSLSDPARVAQGYRASDSDIQLPVSVPQKRRHSQSVSSHGSPPLSTAAMIGPGRGLNMLMHDREHEKEKHQRQSEHGGLERLRMEDERRRGQEREMAAYAAMSAPHSRQRLPHESLTAHMASSSDTAMFSEYERASRHRGRDQLHGFNIQQQHAHRMQTHQHNAELQATHHHTRLDSSASVHHSPQSSQHGGLSLSPSIPRNPPTPRELMYERGELERERLERDMMARERAREMDREKERLLQEQVLLKERELAAREARVREQEMRLRAAAEHQARERKRQSTSEIQAQDKHNTHQSLPKFNSQRADDRSSASLSPTLPRVVSQASSSSAAPHDRHSPEQRRRPPSGQESHAPQHHSSSIVQGPNQTHARHHSRQHSSHPEPSTSLDVHHPHHDTHAHSRPVQKLPTSSRPPPGSKAGRAIANARRDSGGSEGADTADMPQRRGIVKHEDMSMDVDLPPPTMAQVAASATPNPSSITLDTRRAPPSSKPADARPIPQARMISPPSATRSHDHDAIRRAVSQGTPASSSAPRLISLGRSQSSHTPMDSTSRSVSRGAGPIGPPADDADKWLLEQADDAPGPSQPRSLSPPAKRLKRSPEEDSKRSRSHKAKKASSATDKRSKNKRAGSAASRTPQVDEDALLDLERELDSIEPEPQAADAMDVDKELEDLVAGEPTAGTDVDDELMSLVEDKGTLSAPPHRHTSTALEKPSHSPAPRPAPALPRLVSLPSTKEEEDRASMPPPPARKATGGKKAAGETTTKSRSKKGSHKAKVTTEAAPQAPKPKAKSGSRSKARKVDDVRSSEPPAGTPPPVAPKKSHKKQVTTAVHSRSASAMPVEAEKKVDEVKHKETEKEEDDDRLYCICRTLYDENLNMIACDRCDDWYHTICVDLADHEVELVDQFICPLCIEKHPKLHLQTTYKQRCLNGLRHPNPNSPQACHKPARGAFSKYCSDECGVQCMRTRIENWERTVDKEPTNGDEPSPCKAEVIKPCQTKSERDVHQLTQALDEIATLRDDLERGMEVVRYREKLIDLMQERRNLRQKCGWDMRLCYGDEDWTNMAEEVWDSYEDEDGDEEQAEEWWCPMDTKCSRHFKWWEIRQEELSVDKQSKQDALKSLATRERTLRKRLEDLVEAQHAHEDNADTHGPLRSSGPRLVSAAARSRSSKKKTAV
ncbi:hypothetical protein BD626DRAFT_487620 [Schizophyllum amplum]|uniref:PHD-type domain-containing protein n=1 Tax=Schizophyllum amplum TaxID=97359 RepID=A0A550CNJ6_9AGAR|nr:hypothetical protein BD626DRAFT_487620 [Auriculariopsis ampla]